MKVLNRSIFNNDCGDCACDLGDYASGAELGIPLPEPVIYSLELTPECNNQCAGCGNVFANNRTTSFPLAVEEWKKLLNFIAPHAQHLKITGGEPTLHPQFSAIVTEIAHRDIPFTLFTNARWQKPDATVALMRDIAQCTGLLISLHGPDARSHEAFTGVAGSFDETVANIQRATEAGLLVAVSTVLTRYNCSRMPSTVEFASSLGVDHVVFNRYLGAPLPALEPNHSQLREAVHTIETMIAQGAPVRYGNPIPQCLVANSSRGCLAGIAYCTIDPWGNMRPCNHSPTIVGNLLACSLDDLWRSEVMQRWRSISSSSCDACLAFSNCRGGCKALAEIRLEKQDPFINSSLTDLTKIFDPLEISREPQMAKSELDVRAR